MKFVHLTERKNIGLIRRNGIRKGNGRRGRDVYAMPLFFIPKEKYLDPVRWVKSPATESDMLSTGKFWSLLFTERIGKSKGAAIVFSLTDEHWPISLYIFLRSKTGLKFIKWANKLKSNMIVIPDDYYSDAADAFADGYCSDIKLLIGSDRALGRTFHQYKSLGGKPLYPDEIEAVIPLHIPASCIERVLPFYRKNLEMKSNKGKARRESIQRQIDEELS